MGSIAGLARQFARAGGALVLAGMLVCPPSAAEQAQQDYAKAPDNLRAFLRDARAAGTIPDPLQRCLAFPDLPGNRWPAGQARALCQYAYAPAISAQTVSALVERKAYAELDALYRADLDKHFPKQGEASEIIHRDFEIFNGFEQSDRLSREWLDGAPDSAFAMVARASHFSRAAAMARGAATIDKTSKAQLFNMEQHALKALVLLSRALVREPRMIHADVESVNTAKLVGEGGAISEAMRHGEALDPACTDLAWAAMLAMRPRWGGSHEGMAAYARHLAPHLQSRPLLGTPLSALAMDRADTLFGHDQHAERAAFLKPVAQVSSARSLFRTIGMHIARGKWEDDWDALAHQLEWSRFDAGDARAHREVGRTLWRLEQLDWAAESLARAVAVDAADAEARSMLADLSFTLLRDSDAEQAYLKLLDVPAYRKEALLGLLRTELRSGQPEMAWRYVESLNKEFPRFGEAWFYRAYLLEESNGPGREEALEKFLKSEDAAQPRLARQVEVARKRLASLRPPPSP